MPYSIRKVGNKFCVFNKQSGDKKGCSPTREKAEAHMRALYHGESGKKFTKGKK